MGRESEWAGMNLDIHSPKQEQPAEEPAETPLENEHLLTDDPILFIPEDTPRRENLLKHIRNAQRNTREDIEQFGPPSSDEDIEADMHRQSIRKIKEIGIATIEKLLPE